ncbi:MAG TPA: hypothetical protein DCX60_10100 [Phycisphaerales bacterium]|nr:hypothetical protein [Phycisphaerales bacterium]
MGLLLFILESLRFHSPCSLIDRCQLFTEMKMMPQLTDAATKPTTSTKDRILESAVLLFEAQGFDGASVRAICAQAGANIAAINYYFGSKEALYGEVVKHVFLSSEGTESMPLLKHNPSEPIAQLCEWIEWHVTRYLPRHNSTLATFIRRELANPSPLLQEIVDVTVLQSLEALKEIVSAILPGGISEDVLNHHCLQINGPTMVAAILQPINSRMPGFEQGTQSVEMLVRQAQIWSLAGLKANGAEIPDHWFVRN